MGPLLPITILLGSFWYLDRERERTQGGGAGVTSPPPKFSPLAVGRVTTIEEGVRNFQPTVFEDLKPLLRSSGIEPMEIEGTPPGASFFKVIPLVAGGASALDLIERATQSGQAVLGSLALVLGGAPDHQLLLIGTPAIKQHANMRSVFAVLAERPVELQPEPEPEVVEEPPPKPIRRGRANGVTAAAPEPTTIVQEVKEA